MQVASLLKQAIRKTDFIARWGSEEFIVLLIDTLLKNAQLISEQFREKIASNAHLQQQSEKQVTINLGVTQAKDSDDVKSLFKRVDDALYQAKRTGKNKVKISE